MSLRDKRRIKLLALFVIITFVTVSFVFIKKQVERTGNIEISKEIETEPIEENDKEISSDSIKDSEVLNENKKQEKNSVKLSNNNCKYEIKKSNTIIISEYEGIEDCIVIPKEIDGKKVKDIDKKAFESCYNLETIKVPVELKDVIGKIEYFEVNEENSDDEYIELNTTREYSEVYTYYMSLSEEEKQKSLIVPYKFEVSATENEISEVSSSSLPSKYDLRDYVEIEVENQGSHGTCYAYAALSSLETYIARYRGELLDFSEVHASVYSAGEGGIFSDIQNYINNGYGPVWEADWDKEKLADQLSASDYAMVDSYLKGGDFSNAEKNHMKEVLKAQRVEAKVDTKTCTQDKTIKEYVMTYGAVCSYYHHDNKYLAKNYNGYTVYNNTGSILNLPDHAVCIVGWDDNFSRNNFPEEIRPKNNGAFLILNSWGSNWGTDGGYFWISYEDSWMGGMAAVVTGVTGLGDEITLKNTIIKDAETGLKVETVNKINNYVKRGTQVELNLDLRYTSNNKLVNSSEITVVVRNPLKRTTAKAKVSTKNGYIVVNVDTKNFDIGTDCIVDIKYKSEVISKSMRITRNLYDFIVKDDNTVELTAYNGEDLVDVIVPVTYAGVPVSGLSSKLFYDNDIIKTITIYDSVKEIGSNIVPNGVIIFGKINSAAQTYCTNNNYQFVEIGNTKIIGDFWEFDITSKTLNITGNIGNYSTSSSSQYAPWYLFYRSLYYANINESVEKIGNAAFYKCDKLQNVTGLKRVTSIGSHAFRACDSLKTIPGLNNISQIGTRAFYGCNNLEKIYIGKHIASIGTNVFYGTSLTIHGFKGTIAETYANSNNINFKELSFVSMKIKDLPNKIRNILNKDINLRGGTILATYEEQMTEEVLMTDSRVSITGYDKTKLGEQQVTVTYKGASDVFTIKVTNDITGVLLKNHPNKTQYIKGEELDLTGGRINVFYQDGTYEEIPMTDRQITATGYDSSLLGEQQISITYEGKTIKLNVSVTNDMIAIQIKDYPVKTKYIKGEELDLTGGKIVAIYEDKSTDEILLSDDRVTVTGYDKTIIGEQEVIITYKEKTTKFNVKVTNNIESIQIIETPNKVQYIKGAELDLTGGKISVIYEDGTKEEIEITDPQVIVTGYDKSIIGEQKLIVTYKEKVTEFNIKVTNDIEKMEVINLPIKTQYIKGEEIDLTGGEISATYEDGTVEQILMTDSRVTVTGYDKTLLGEQYITIKCNDIVVAVFSVTITNNILEVKIVELPIKTQYIKGEELDLTGGKISVIYEDETKEEIEIINPQVIVTGYDKNVLGEQKLIVTYKEKVTEFIIKVTNKIISAKVKVNPDKIIYIEGEELNLTGGKILLTYEDKTTEDILMTDSKVIISGYNKNIIGSQTVKLKYLNYIIPLKVTVIPKTILDNEVHATDIELELKENNKSEQNNLVVMNLSLKSDKNDIGIVSGKIEENANISNVEVIGKNGWNIEYNKENGEFIATKTEGAKDEDIAEIKYTIKKNNTDQKINTIISNISFTTLENKNLLGKDIEEEVSLSKSPEEDNKQEQTDEDLKENNKQDSEVEMVKKLESIEIIKKPFKLSYTAGEEFNTKGMKIVAKYSDGTIKEITDYMYAPYGSLREDDNSIEIIYVEGEEIKTTKYNINVEKNKDSSNDINNNIQNDTNNNTNNNENKTDLEQSTVEKENNSFDFMYLDKYGIYILIAILFIAVIFLFKRK